MRIFKGLSKLPFIKGMSHNGRVVFATEAFWSIPFNLFTVYAVLYMLELGITETQVGTIQVVLVCTQVLSAFFSGTVTDLLGRKRTITLFDLLSWCVACFVWAFSGSYLGFFIAACLNGTNKLAYVSFQCLLSEGSSSSERLHNYSGLHFMILAGGLFAPLGGLIVESMGIIKGTRVLYLFGAIVIGTMFVFRHFAFHETTAPSRTKSLGTLKGLGHSLKFFISHKQIRIVFILQAIAQFYLIFKPLFYFAFLRDTLGVSNMFLSIVPFVLSIITMLILLFILPKIKDHQRKNYLFAGLLVGCFSLVFLVMSMQGHFLLLVLSIILDGVSIALMRPLTDSLWANSLQDEGRTRQLAAGNLFLGLISIPAGSLAASLYIQASYLPFIVASGLLFVAAILSLGLSKEI